MLSCHSVAKNSTAPLTPAFRIKLQPLSMAQRPFSNAALACLNSGPLILSKDLLSGRVISWKFGGMQCYLWSQCLRTAYSDCCELRDSTHWYLLEASQISLPRGQQ